MLGERLASLVSFEELKLAAGAVLLSPYLPLLFMGEEYGETAPFLYFVSHSDPDLVEAVRRGRSEEFAAFRDQGEPPDPIDPATFERSRLNHELCREGAHRALRDYYRELIRLRRTLPALAHLSKDTMEVMACGGESVLTVHRWLGEGQTFMAINFAPDEATATLPEGARGWALALNSADLMWAGPGHPAPRRLEVGDGERLVVPGRTLLLYINDQEAAL